MVEFLQLRRKGEYPLMQIKQDYRNNSKYKRIWITTDWEANSLIDKNAQCGRMNQLAHYLAKNGYEVVLWFTTYVHPEKRYLCNKTKVIRINENERIVLLHSCVSYKKNTSPKRFMYHSILAAEMEKLIKNGVSRFSKPDIIFCSYPTEQFCSVALKYGERHGVPVIMDEEISVKYFSIENSEKTFIRSIKTDER